MKKLPLFITACLLVSFFSGCDEWRGSTKPEPQPKSKTEPQPEKLKSNTHTRSPSVACSADGKTVYWITNATGSIFRNTMYKSEDGGKTWVVIYPYPPMYPPSEQAGEEGYVPDLFDFKTEEKPTKARPIPRIPRNGK
jgi:hypothetical protein